METACIIFPRKKKCQCQCLKHSSEKNRLKFLEFFIYTFRFRVYFLTYSTSQKEMALKKFSPLIFLRLKAEDPISLLFSIVKATLRFVRCYTLGVLASWLFASTCMAEFRIGYVFNTSSKLLYFRTEKPGLK